MAKKNKVRVDLRKNRTKPPRGNDLTRQFADDAGAVGDISGGERVRAKGDISRRRTVVLDDHATAADGSMPAAKSDGLLRGRVLRVHGLFTYVEADDGRMYRCSLRRLLKSLQTDGRSVVTTGDIVWFRPSSLVPRPSANPADAEGGPGDAERVTKDDGRRTNDDALIERVDPRRGVLTRASRRREHVLVANVDQLVIVMSLVEPDLKPHLIDRYIATALKGELSPVICLNKCDLTDPVALQPMIGAYSQAGVPTVLTSARTGVGVGRLRELLKGRATVFSGQSGVGKSSLLNAVQPDLGLRVREVSEGTSKGRHTTTTAELIRLDTGGWVVDTPGVRQLQLWDTRAEEVEGYFRDFRPYVPLCGFPDCSHTHEERCAVKAAVQRRHLSDRRYHSYLGLYHGVEE